MNTIGPFFNSISQRADKACLTNKQMKDLVRQLDRAMDNVAKLKNEKQVLEKDVVRLDKNQRTFADVIASGDPKEMNNIMEKIKGREHHFLSLKMYDQLFPDKGSSADQKEVDKALQERKKKSRDLDRGLGW